MHAEDVANDSIKDITDACTTWSRACTVINSCMSKLIIGRAFTFIGQYIVGFFCFLKFFFCRCVSLIPIWMMFHRQSSVCLFQFSICRVL